MHELSPHCGGTPSNTVKNNISSGLSNSLSLRRKIPVEDTNETYITMRITLPT